MANPNNSHRSGRKRYRRCKSSQPKPIPTINCLPTDLLADIFSRLPLKTLLSCKCVSKLFLSLISHPCFTQLHLSTSPVSLLVRPIGIYREEKNRPRKRVLRLFDLREPQRRLERLDIPFNSHFPISAFKLVSSCNGLLCTVNQRTIYVCNPILGEFITLPKYPNPNDNNLFVDMVAIGLSLNTTKQYKVVRIWSNSHLALTAEVYFIGDGTMTWKSIGKPPTHFNSPCSGVNIYVNGAAHWLLSGPLEAPMSIGAFDFDTDLFRLIPRPAELNCDTSPGAIFRVGSLNGHLSIVEWMCHPNIVEIWAMMEYGLEDSWTKLYSVCSPIGNRWLPYLPLRILSDGTLLMLCWDSVIRSFNPNTGEFSSHDTSGAETPYQLNAISFSPSLVSLRGIVNGEKVMVCS